jgi:hypothetical protein
LATKTTTTNGEFFAVFAWRRRRGCLPSLIFRVKLAAGAYFPVRLERSETLTAKTDRKIAITSAVYCKNMLRMGDALKRRQQIREDIAKTNFCGSGGKWVCRRHSRQTA